MPTKFKQSQTTRERQTNKITTTHYWMKGMPKAELFDYINNDNGRPRIKQKCRNELVRRGVELVYVDKTE